MISKYRNSGLTWIDLESPKEEEVLHVIEEYPILEFIKDELHKNDFNHRFEINDEMVFASLVFPELDNSLDKKKNNKLTFVINDDLVLTAHDKPMEALKTFSKELELDTYSGEDSKIYNNKILFTHLLKNLYIHSEDELLKNKMEMINLKKKITKHNKKLKLVSILTASFFVAIILILSYVISNI